jgi:hypothetical protein
MSLSDVAGVFSRYFIVGFFLPSFFILVGLSQALTDGFLPPVYANAGSDGARIALLGGTALLAGLLLLGLNYRILRLFEGYPLMRQRFARPLYWALNRWQLRRRMEAEAQTVDPGSTPVQRRNALWRMDRRFRQDVPDVLPTAFGNVVRAAEAHSAIRWGLNSIAVGTLVEMLFSSEEKEVHSDAKGDVAFFVNGALLACVAGIVLLVDEVVEASHALPVALIYAVPFLMSLVLYWAAIGAAIKWGEAVRASVDLHRFDLYEKIGLRLPRDFEDEQLNVAPALNAALLRGESIPAPLAAGYRPDNRLTVNLGSWSFGIHWGSGG